MKILIILDLIILIFKLDKSFEDHSYEVDLSTDDWPFLYMPKKIYPLTYLSIVSVLLLSSVYFINKFFKINRNNYRCIFFFLEQDLC